MNKYDFEGQVAIVTGGAQGMGFAVAKLLTNAGAKVAIWDIDKTMAESSAASLVNGNATPIEVDICNYKSVLNAYRETIDALGKVDVLVHSAGIAGPNASVEEYPIDAWDSVMSVDLNGVFYVNKVVIKGMKEQNYGRIVNVASVAGKEGNPNACAYSAAKAGVIAFTKSLGKELASYDIAVNCVTPAAAKTRIFDQMSEEHINYMLSKIPRNRFLKVEEAASMIAWLASSENSFTTSAVFDLSGGRATY
jgi:NAD(P)-dependent dehydrogenase (short-subunit alcohol dehydrogenase family)